MFVVRTLEPDRLGGGRKQVSKEYVEPSRILVQDDPERAEEEARMLLEQQRRDKKRSKKKEYMKKKKAKQQECSKQTLFDEALLLQASHVSQQTFKDGATMGAYLLRSSNQLHQDPDYLQEQSNMMMTRYEHLIKQCTVML